MRLTPKQVWTARRRLGMSQSRLAAYAGLAQSHVSTFERTGHLPRSFRGWDDRLAALRAALECAGAILEDDTVMSQKDASKPAERVIKPTPSQIREARMLLEMTQTKLARLASVSPAYVSRYESRGSTDTKPRARDCLAAIRAAIEAAGVEFTNGDAPGVRLRGAESSNLTSR